VSEAERFSKIFDGLKQAYGTYRIEKRNASGKNVGKATVLREPRTLKHWQGHLSGKGDGVGIIPINEDNNCIWGCIDIDQYPLDHATLIEKIRKAKLPLVVCRSKSGGAHLFLFSSAWIAAKDMQDALRHMAGALGYGNCEIFPKQIELSLDRGDVGNFLNMPYFDAEKGLRYAFLDDGSAATLDQFFDLYERFVRTPEQIDALMVTETEKSADLQEGPPCLQTLSAQKISEGGRNNGLFNLGVYLRKAYPDSWESEILKFNLMYLEPPLPLSEVNIVARQLNKKEYAYRCKDAPINAYCNAELCKTRKYGIGSAVSGASISNLRKYNSSPPVWFVDVNGRPLEVDTDSLMNQPMFQKACVDQLNFFPRSMQKAAWEGRINTLLQTMTETDGAVMEVSIDASLPGQLYDHLEEWCTSLQRAATREEILLRRPYTDVEEGKTYFRLRDFENYLKKQRFFDFKTHKIAQRLRDRNGESTVIRIKERLVRVWAIPAFTAPEVSVTPPQFERKKDPF